jgi:hypothetical protein
MSKGRISIGMWSSNVPPYSGVRIEVIDDKSRAHFLRLQMTPEQFANALFGRAEQECEFDLAGIANVGKLLETKEQIVEISYDVYSSRDEALVDEALAKYEVDGWVARTQDATNHHRLVSHNIASDTVKVKVSFHRYVEAA